MKQLRWIAILMACMLLFSGCRPAGQITSYEAPKETFGTQGGGGEAQPGESAGIPGRMLVALVEKDSRVWFIKLLGEAGAVGERADVFRQFVDSIEFVDGKPEWQLPERWQEKPGSGMRFATINVGQPGLDVSVISLPAPQEVLSNVNRWRKQLQLEEISADDIAENVQEAQVGDAKASLIDIAGIMSSGGTGMSAPFMSGRAGPASSGRGAPEIGNSAGPVSAPKNPDFEFEKPDSWSPGRMNSMRKAAFNAKSAEGEVEMTVTTLSAGGAALLPNINRWRGQVGLPPTDEAELKAELEEIEIGGIKSNYIELVGSDTPGPQKSTLAVITIRDGTAWFFKLMGDAATVAAEKSNFESFLKSVQFSS